MALSILVRIVIVANCIMHFSMSLLFIRRLQHSGSPILSKRLQRKQFARVYLTTNIYVVGKKNSVDTWIQNACADYEGRLEGSGAMKIQTHFLKSDDALSQIVRSLHSNKNKGFLYALDEKGIEFTSKEFKSEIYRGFELGGATINFVIGGFGGLPTEVKNEMLYHKLISLSKMTWTHQMARLLLIEQIYRAVEINKGSGYHKE